LNSYHLSLGSNQENRLHYLMHALNVIRKSGCQLTNLSDVYETDSWGYESADNFLNVVVQIRTNLQPDELLGFIQGIENDLLRKRGNVGYEDRPLDIDILFFNNNIIVSDDLCIPHPLIHMRKFCVQPVCDIDPELIHPVLNLSMSEIIEKSHTHEHITCFMKGQNLKVLTLQQDDNPI
jgi:2-amino-4-hydroxy-6-hydroxymethyldihydropteridine diphosphokinase